MPLTLSLPLSTSSTWLCVMKLKRTDEHWAPHVISVFSAAAILLPPHYVFPAPPKGGISHTLGTTAVRHRMNVLLREQLRNATLCHWWHWTGLDALACVCVCVRCWVIWEFLYSVATSSQRSCNSKLQLSVAIFCCNLFATASRSVCRAASRSEPIGLTEVNRTNLDNPVTVSVCGPANHTRVLNPTSSSAEVPAASFV